jgi:hypothetical protein
MDDKTARLLGIWNRREETLISAIVKLRAKQGGPESVGPELAKAEAQLAELRTCRLEFNQFFNVTPSNRPGQSRPLEGGNL